MFMSTAISMGMGVAMFISAVFLMFVEMVVMPAASRVLMGMGMFFRGTFLVLMAMRTFGGMPLFELLRLFAYEVQRVIVATRA